MHIMLVNKFTESALWWSLRVPQGDSGIRNNLPTIWTKFWKLEKQSRFADFSATSHSNPLAASSERELIRMISEGNGIRVHYRNNLCFPVFGVLPLPDPSCHFSFLLRRLQRRLKNSSAHVRLSLLKQLPLLSAGLALQLDCCRSRTWTNKPSLFV